MSNPQNDQKDVINKLGTILLDPVVYKKIDDTLSAYSNWNKTTIIGFQGTIILGIRFFLDEPQAFALWRLITNYPEWMENTLKLCDTDEIKEVLLSIHSKFFPIFGGCDTMNVDDWARLSWYKTIDIAGYPSFKFHIFKRNGEQFFIETTTSGVLSLVSYITQQLAVSMSEKTPPLDDVMNNHIESIKGSLDQITAKNKQ